MNTVLKIASFTELVLQKKKLSPKASGTINTSKSPRDVGFFSKASLNKFRDAVQGTRKVITNHSIIKIDKNEMSVGYCLV